MDSDSVTNNSATAGDASIILQGLNLTGGEFKVINEVVSKMDISPMLAQAAIPILREKRKDLHNASKVVEYQLRQGNLPSVEQFVFVVGFTATYIGVMFLINGLIGLIIAIIILAGLLLYINLLRLNRDRRTGRQNDLKKYKEAIEFLNQQLIRMERVVLRAF